MKPIRFSVFLKERPIHLDVVLHDRTTNIDVTIEKLPLRSTLQGSMGIVVDACVEYMTVHGMIDVSGGIEIAVQDIDTQKRMMESFADSIIVRIDLEEDMYAVLDPSDNSIIIDASAAMSLRRLRKLYEMDDLTLGDFDGMSLDDVDYITL